ncbi:RrF2 family transcriptional regulator [Oleidesulfovibrio sp.]|uniref:RrF2 family transcriptional regulator n=1 Tax=Oleidesulfovibrio sp. TaxID=2909707 RepID=UPI003A88DC35
MKLTTRSRYGTRMLLDIAMNTHGDDHPVSIKEIADRQGISMKYLEKLIRVLKGAGYISSKLGSKGGYMLSRSPETILLGDVVFALEETVPTFECVDPEPCCPRMDYCLTRTIWNEAAKAMYEKLNSFTLADLISDAELCPKSGRAC